ncbi:MAG: Uma2 family endonuclease [Anaerolineae bacterium]|nr:Uma2 family endonuclease [Thermoflexales bacterium]MDW8395921.1 Uma2 family endonuclease [Anaerolineae bacterium]
MQPAPTAQAEQTAPQPSASIPTWLGDEPNLLTPEVIAEFARRMESLVTEDDTPVDNLFSAKQQRLLVDSLYASWQHPRFGTRFLADANVGVYYLLDPSGLVVPDCFVSVDVTPIADLWSKPGRSYMVWMYGKPPDVVVEIVSNREGKELGEKLAIYERMRVRYYVVYDPQRLLGEPALRVFVNTAEGWQALPEGWMSAIGLGVKLWQGEYERVAAEWLRWCDAEGNVLLTGEERAERAEARAERAEARADQAEQQLALERQRAERLAAQLRALGVDPDALTR